MTAARRALEELAQHLRPTADPVLDPEDDERLIVATDSATILVEPIATLTTAVARAYYRNPQSGRIYGRIGEPKATAAVILAELQGDGQVVTDDGPVMT